MKARVALAAVLAIVLAFAGCAPSNEEEQENEKSELVVFAAASFTTVLPKVADAFKQDNPDVIFTFSFDGSPSLIDQLKAGAAADMLITADENNMNKAVSAGLVTGTPEVFATNTLTLIVPQDNPGRITGLNTSLNGKNLVICADGVPCGTATRQLAKLNGYTLKPVSEETKVTDVAGKVTSGQADAGIVYVTDAKLAGTSVEVIDIPHADEVRTQATAGITSSAAQPDLAEKFQKFLTSEKAQEIFGDADFGSP